MKYFIIFFIILFSFTVSYDDAFALPVWQKHLDGQIRSVDTSVDGSHIVAGIDINATAGKVYYFDKDGSLLWVNEQDRIMAKVSVSEDGSRVLASGYQLFGRGGFYTNPSMYMFDQSGNLLWKYQNTNRTDLSHENQFLTGEITLEKKILITSDQEIMYLDSDGNLLWNYSIPGRTSGMKISLDESTIALGVNGEQDYTWWLYVLDNFGNLLWKYDGIDGIIQGGAVSLSSDGEKIVIGSMASGDFGNLYMFDNKGHLLWKRNVDGGILSIDLSSNGRFAVVESNYGTTVFDEHGDMIDSKPAFYTTLSSDDSLIVGANPVWDHYDLIFFDTQLNPILIEQIASAIDEISANGKQVVVGTRQQTELGKSGVLYLFENNVSDPVKILSPLKQFKSGTSFDEIQCKNNFILLQKYDGSPACVKPVTKQHLIDRGWGLVDKSIERGLNHVENSITINDTDMAINYHITGGKIFSVSGHSRESSGIGQLNQTSLFLILDVIENGDLTLVLPRNVIDAKVGDIDDGFFVVLDGMETEYTETKTITDRTISFSFPAGTKNVEIIGYGYYNENFSNY